MARLEMSAGCRPEAGVELVACGVSEDVKAQLTRPSVSCLACSRTPAGRGCRDLILALKAWLAAAPGLHVGADALQCPSPPALEAGSHLLEQALWHARGRLF